MRVSQLAPLRLSEILQSNQGKFLSPREDWVMETFVELFALLLPFLFVHNFRDLQAIS